MDFDEICSKNRNKHKNINSENTKQQLLFKNSKLITLTYVNQQ